MRTAEEIVEFVDGLQKGLMVEFQDTLDVEYLAMIRLTQEILNFINE